MDAMYFLYLLGRRTYIYLTKQDGELNANVDDDDDTYNSVAQDTVSSFLMMMVII